MRRRAWQPDWTQGFPSPLDNLPDGTVLHSSFRTLEVELSANRVEVVYEGDQGEGAYHPERSLATNPLGTPSPLRRSRLARPGELPACCWTFCEE